LSFNAQVQVLQLGFVAQLLRGQIMMRVAVEEFVRVVDGEVEPRDHAAHAQFEEEFIHGFGQFGFVLGHVPGVDFPE
jgi:hypothetical protein